MGSVDDVAAVPPYRKPPAVELNLHPVGPPPSRRIKDLSDERAPRLVLHRRAGLVAWPLGLVLGFGAVFLASSQAGALIPIVPSLALAGCSVALSLRRRGKEEIEIRDGALWYRQRSRFEGTPYAALAGAWVESTDDAGGGSQLHVDRFLAPDLVIGFGHRARDLEWVARWIRAQIKIARESDAEVQR